MSSLIEALCILVLCLFGFCCSGTKIDSSRPADPRSVVLRIPGVPVDLEVTALVRDQCPCEPESRR